MKEIIMLAFTVIREAFVWRLYMWQNQVSLLNEKVDMLLLGGVMKYYLALCQMWGLLI